MRLYETGFKDRYYESKFDVLKDHPEFRTLVAHEYVLGLCWVLQYYYQVGHLIFGNKTLVRGRVLWC